MQIGKVYTFKLGSGEEMIAKVTCIDNHTVLIEDPVSVAPGPQGMGLIPSMFTSDPAEKTQLNMNCVSIWCLTDDSIRLKYAEAVSGIKVPKKKLILG